MFRRGYKLYNLLKICGIRTPSTSNYRIYDAFSGHAPRLHSETLKVELLYARRRYTAIITGAMADNYEGECVFVHGCYLNILMLIFV